MAKTARKKYVPKNPGEFKQLRKCHLCGEPGIVSYRKGIAGTEHTCIDHLDCYVNSKGVIVKRHRTVSEFLAFLWKDGR